MKLKLVERALEMIQNGMIVGLGGGSTVAELTKKLGVSTLDIKVVTPSYSTALLCQKNGLTVLDASLISSIDLAFDGCDEVDSQLNALKSGGAIHTAEKIIATMAEEYILLIDEIKYFETLPFNKNITLEVLPLAQELVKKELVKNGGEVVERLSTTSDGCTCSENGNLIFEVNFEQVSSIEELNQLLMSTPGIIDSSLFYQIATKVLVATQTEIKTIQRSV